MTAPSPEWHWEQGAKFAVEGIKTALLLNGAAAIALLTFVANAKPRGVSGAIVSAVVLFAAGALSSALAFIAAYRTQVEYGNAKVQGADEARVWKKGQRWNVAAVLLVLLSVLMFAFGIVVAACAIKSG